MAIDSQICLWSWKDKDYFIQEQWSFTNSAPNLCLFQIISIKSIKPISKVDLASFYSNSDKVKNDFRQTESVF